MCNDLTFSLFGPRELLPSDLEPNKSAGDTIRYLMTAVLLVVMKRRHAVDRSFLRSHFYLSLCCDHGGKQEQRSSRS